MDRKSSPNCEFAGMPKDLVSKPPLQAKNNPQKGTIPGLEALMG
jgi:hypothetical protein